MERIGDYDYSLPEELIAQTPLADRSASRLLHLDRRTGAIAHRTFVDCVDILVPGDLLVLNETRVSAIRLVGRKPTGGAVEALLMRRIGPSAFEALLGASRGPRVGTTIDFGDGLSAVVASRNGRGPWRLEFEPAPDLDARLDAAGYAPLPPYIRAPLADREHYQTVYGRVEGSAAAPTAGLHFTDQVFASLTRKGVRIAKVTLDVGTDTFRPLNVEHPEDHEMVGETCAVPPETVQAVAEATGRIIAVGTTTVRTLESFAVGRKKLESGKMTSRLFIRPGFEFRIVDGMFTNFHMPRTTMMMMISALAGREAVQRAYLSAVENRYRFLSFGDSMLIL